MGLRLLAVSVFLLVLAGGASAASEDVTVLFRTPTGNVSCAYTKGKATQLRCDVRNGVRPLPRKPSTCRADWGAGMHMGLRGRAQIVCASDSVFSPSARPVPYGWSWRRDGLKCLSRRDGLYCINRARHGWFMSRQRSFRF